MANFWQNEPILAWVIDDFEQFNQILQQRGFDLNSYVDSYTRNSFSKTISKLFFSSPFSLNLGGETKKNKLIATDKPIGVFNFSLASKTLYPLSEFYSDRLAKEDPKRFESLNLLSGIVPNILVEYIIVGGDKKYYYKDEKGVEYPCEKRVKGTTAIERGEPNAKLEYKSKTKKVFQTYKRKGGKVRYVEIYSLFYYTRINGDLQYAIRHLPAMIVAEYLESVGIKTRIYMTRFVRLGGTTRLREFDIDTKAKLPMYEQPIVAARSNSFSDQLLIQPIIAKEFQQEIHNPLAYLISSDSHQDVYENLAQNTIKRETMSSSKSVYGDPTWNQVEYWEGFERYRNKYLQYVKDGLFKAKEVLPEAMIMFHDLSINKNLSNFTYYARNFSERTTGVRKKETDAILMPEVNIFFNWWMKTSANIIKHKVNLVNSNEFTKDLREIKTDVENSVRDVNEIIEKTQESELKRDFIDLKESIFSDMEIIIVKKSSGIELLDFDHYINSLINELMVFSDDDFYPTPEEEVEKRLAFKLKVIEELKKV